jgi:hypothetical protein
MPWSSKFADPIPLPNGRKLVTLKDAATYITSLPKKEANLPEWQAAIEALMLCSRGGDPMLARIGVMRALNRHVVREFDSTRKDLHWGRRRTNDHQDRPMTTIENLLERKQKLLERLQGNPGTHERDEIEGQLAQIDTALDMLEGPGESSDEQ